jgi:hypothetical protein
MKALTTIWIAALMLVAISCSKEPLSYPQAASTQMKDNIAVQNKGHYIGQLFGGGIIFYIDSTGKHGLIADTVDLAPATWSNGVWIVTGATAFSIASGKSNTNKIVLVQGKPGNYVALECKKSLNGGHKDWFLPSLSELDALQNQQSMVGGFTGTYYWSSTEGSQNYAWIKNFTAGWHDQTQKGFVGSVRAIRYF